MTFSERVKLKVKKKAMFQCCRCHSIGVDVHHIEYQREDGGDIFKNAAPLCPNCHRWFGDNPTKKTEIRQMRDNWYEVIERKFGPNSSGIVPEIEKMNNILIKQSTDLGEMKNSLKEISDKAIDSMTLGTAKIVASNMAIASGASLSNVRTEDISEVVNCPECGESVVVSKTDNACPGCQAFIR